MHFRIYIIFILLCLGNTAVAQVLNRFAPDTTEITKLEIIDTIKPFLTVEQMPAYPGGESEMHKFIANNLRYPVISEENGIVGRVVIRFVVTKTGNITNIEALRGGHLCDSLISMVRKMPQWIPGRQNGKAVDVYFTLPMHINFRK